MPRIHIGTLPTLSPLERRQVVVSSDSNDHGGLSGGAIAGIVIGSVAGFLLILWIWRSCTNLGAPPTEPWYDDGPPRRHKRRGRSHYYRESYPVRTSSRRRYSAEIPIATAERVSVTEPVPVVVRSHSTRRHGRSPRRPSSHAGTAYVVEETTTTAPGHRRSGSGRYYETY
ncbi:hypothetical protein F503_07785 [Ophiostoma piceae UAMH 11346]|uniref:Uncharacterized protein n=1 Tax=Ophiostoma piceae (strain UAMH 11346) TaxID=1262450 RepID=S3C0S2_OPHP1|nr:hypothetical protein F503_07785 [Ophiostoma piceae UAMH 11346]